MEVKISDKIVREAVDLFSFISLPATTNRTLHRSTVRKRVSSFYDNIRDSRGLMTQMTLQVAAVQVFCVEAGRGRGWPCPEKLLRGRRMRAPADTWQTAESEAAVVTDTSSSAIVRCYGHLHLLSCRITLTLIAHINRAVTYNETWSKLFVYSTHKCEVLAS